MTLSTKAYWSTMYIDCIYFILIKVICKEIIFFYFGNHYDSMSQLIPYTLNEIGDVSSVIF
jgi:hypothetical protein